MSTSELIESIKQHEGYRKMPYQCTEGFWTVGWGHNIHFDEIAVYGEVGEFLTKLTDIKTHEDWLENDITRAANAAEDWINDDEAWETMPEQRQNVLIEMAFQMGPTGIGRFKKTRQYIIQGKWIEASDEMLDSLWAQQTPNRAQELSRRFRGAV